MNNNFNLLIKHTKRENLPELKFTSFSSLNSQTISDNFNKSEKSNYSDYLRNNFKGFSCEYTKSCSSSLDIIFYSLKLKHEDSITVFTTSGNKYISNCVIRQIEKYCNLSREISNKTKAILIIHEFGYSLDIRDIELPQDIPIIADVAYSFLSSTFWVKDFYENYSYIVTSLPKFLPIPNGGLIYTNNSKKIKLNNDFLLDECLSSIENNVNSVPFKIEEIILKRKKNLSLYSELIGLKFPQHLVTENFDIPSVYLFNAPLNNKEDQRNFREFMFSKGIMNTIFYGRNAAIVPCHEMLSEDDVRFITEAIKYFFSS